MAEILHQFIGSLSHYLQGFVHPRWCKISAINSISPSFNQLITCFHSEELMTQYIEFVADRLLTALGHSNLIIFSA